MQTQTVLYVENVNGAAEIGVFNGRLLNGDQVFVFACERIGERPEIDPFEVRLPEVVDGMVEIEAIDIGDNSFHARIIYPDSMRIRKKACRRCENRFVLVA